MVVEPDTGIITDTALTPAAGVDNSDAAVGVDLLLGTDQQPEQGEQGEVLADSAYGTGDALEAIERAGHTAILEPGRCVRRWMAGFTLDDFTVVEPDAR